MAISSNALDVQTFDGATRKKQAEQAYAATSALTVSGDGLVVVPYAQLTGAMTINATVTDLEEGCLVLFTFIADGTNRVVTFGTNITASGTLTVTASQTAVAIGYFDGTNIRIFSREVTA